MPVDKAQAERCLERHGYSYPLQIDPVACKCDGCTGKLLVDAIGQHRAFLTCDHCGCTYWAPKAAPRFTLSE
jgi:hypothetical protein